jgi:hypothetical protein
MRDETRTPTARDDARVQLRDRARILQSDGIVTR